MSGTTKAIITLAAAWQVGGLIAVVAFLGLGWIMLPVAWLMIAMGDRPAAER